MAKMTNLTVNICAEKLIQQKLIRFAQEIYDDHGLMIKDINFDWLDVASVEAPIAKVCSSAEMASVCFSK